MKHSRRQPCPLCEKKLKDGHETLVKAFKAVVSAYPNAHVSWTFRSEQEQNEAHKRGASRLKWPDSKHNKKPSLAMDLFQIRDDGVASWDLAFFKACAELLRPTGIKCGLDWERFKDPPHFEV